MKKLLLLSLLFSTITTFSQDWAPFRANDSIVNFISDTTVDLYQTSRNHVIQTVQIDTSWNIGNNKVVIFKKGVSLVESELVGSNLPQSARGRILGDTLVLTLDTSYYNSAIDIATQPHLPFSLKFPHRISINSNWKLGNSDSLYLFATVVSKNNQIVMGTPDSVATIQLEVRNKFNVIVNSHPFHNAKIAIGKNFGLFKGLDFTTQSHRIEYSLLNKQPLLIGSQDIFQLQVGDLYHFMISDNFNFINDAYERKVIAIDSLAFSRKVTIQNKYKKQYYSNTHSIVIDTIEQFYPFDTTYFPTQSQVIEDSMLNGLTLYTRGINYYTIDSSNSIFPLQISRFYNELSYLSLPNHLTQVAIRNFGLAYDNHNFIIGLDNEYNSYWNSGNSANAPRKTISYVKKGNQTWGSPISNFIVGLKDVSFYQENQLFYPNPATSSITINAKVNPISIKILDINARLVKNFEAQNELDISELPTGIYFLQLQTADENRIEKFIKK